ncbi:hypothetical protein M0805_007724 [Coniferiporia weirii]|nr:hypothetical protein M0805_007724 [Coniferiporia weirii]
MRAPKTVTQFAMLSTRSGVEQAIDSNDILLYLAYKQAIYVESLEPSLIVSLLVTTFDKEVKYFWSSPRGTASIVYFLNRYIGIFSAFAFAICELTTPDGLSVVSTITEIAQLSSNTRIRSYWMTMVLIDYILLIRVIALWSEEKKLAMCLKAFFAIEFAFMLGVWIGGTVLEKVSVIDAGGFTLCGYENNVSPLLYTLYWTAPLVFELILMVLALYKAAHFWRESGGFGGANLVKVLIQDQALYFVLVMVCCGANIINILVDPNYSSNAAINIVQAVLMIPTIPCIIGCRLMVHLKEASERGENGGMSYRIQRSVSEIQFA